MWQEEEEEERNGRKTCRNQTGKSNKTKQKT